MTKVTCHCRPRKAMKIRGTEPFWLSENGNVAVIYEQFALGAKYKVFRKVRYGEKEVFEFAIALENPFDAIRYGKKIVDQIVDR